MILFGAEGSINSSYLRIIITRVSGTNNTVNTKDGGYEHVYEFVPIGTPTAETIAKLSELKPSDEHGDRML